jgi:predicted transcriptional regulator
MKILGYENEINISNLARYVIITYCHTFNKIVPRLVNWGCVEIDRMGRENRLRLTPKGLEVFGLLVEIREILGFSSPDTNKYMN